MTEQFIIGYVTITPDGHRTTRIRHPRTLRWMPYELGRLGQPILIYLGEQTFDGWPQMLRFSHPPVPESVYIKTTTKTGDTKTKRVSAGQRLRALQAPDLPTPPPAPRRRTRPVTALPGRAPDTDDEDGERTAYISEISLRNDGKELLRTGRTRDPFTGKPTSHGLGIVGEPILGYLGHRISHQQAGAGYQLALPDIRTVTIRKYPAYGAPQAGTPDDLGAPDLPPPSTPKLGLIKP